MCRSLEVEQEYAVMGIFAFYQQHAWEQQMRGYQSKQALQTEKMRLWSSESRLEESKLNAAENLSFPLPHLKLSLFEI